MMPTAPFEQILEENKGIILRFCLLHASSNEDQKDLFQEISYQIWKAIPGFRGDSSLTTWIYKIAMRTALNYQIRERKRKNKMKSFVEISAGANLEDTEDHRIQKLRSCISKLNSVNKMVVSMHLDGQAHREIGQVMGISENLVAVKMRRLKNKLFHCIKSILP